MQASSTFNSKEEIGSDNTAQKLPDLNHKSPKQIKQVVQYISQTRGVLQ